MIAKLMYISSIFNDFYIWIGARMARIFADLQNEYIESNSYLIFATVGRQVPKSG